MHCASFPIRFIYLLAQVAEYNAGIVHVARDFGMTNIVETSCLQGFSALKDKVSSLWVKLVNLKSTGKYLHKDYADYMLVLWPPAKACSTLIYNMMKFNMRLGLLGTKSLLKSTYFKGRGSPLKCP
jgi:hypothetical protein